MSQAMDDVDRALIRATQTGIPVSPRPYADIADAIGIAEDEVIARLQRMLSSGAVRRIAAVPNHYALGIKVNAMTVWDVADDEMARLGPLVGGLDFVTHCYRRPRHPPLWPYNLFAMVHGRAQAEVDDKIEQIRAMLGEACRGHDVLVSKRILKKTGLRIAG